MYWGDSALRFRFAAVLQGGGIRGLFFPGHMVGLVRRGVGKIFVSAGASPRALVAIGIWAGLPPNELKPFLSSRCGRFGLATSMFSVWDAFVVIWTWAMTAVVLVVNGLLRLVIAPVNFVLWVFAALSGRPRVRLG